MAGAKCVDARLRWVRERLLPENAAGVGAFAWTGKRRGQLKALFTGEIHNPCIVSFAPSLTIVLAQLAGMAVADAAPEVPRLRGAQDLFDQGRLLATGGVTTVEGAGGGGLVPWATITGYGTEDAIGVNGHATIVDTGDYRLETAGLAIGLFDRLELSYAHQWFDTKQVGAALGLGAGYRIEQDIFGAKLRLFGDLVYDQDTLLPQVAVGVQYKINNRGDLLTAIGAGDDEGVDYYVSATKLFLAESLLANVTLRYTKANQFGILGFGGDLNDDYELQFEGSVAWLLDRHFAIGAEYRAKPDNLGIAAEDDAFDVFAAFFPSKNVSVTIAYADLGNIVIRDRQRGVYLSLQAGF